MRFPRRGVRYTSAPLFDLHEIRNTSARSLKSLKYLPNPVISTSNLCGWCECTGGKGTVRRKIVRKPKASTAQDDKKLQGALKKLSVQPIAGVEEVNMFREDGNVLHFTAPKGEWHPHSRSLHPSRMYKNSFADKPQFGFCTRQIGIPFYVLQRAFKQKR